MGAAFVTRGVVTIGNLDPKSLQGERAMVNILDTLGAEATWRDDGFLHINCTHLPDRIDVAIRLEDCPNILPTVAAIAATAPGRVRITGARLTQFHKSPRIEAMAAELGRAGVDVTILRDRDDVIDGLDIRGQRTQLGGVTFADHGDHRIFMALALLAMACRQPCSFAGACDTSDSFPAFHDLLRLDDQAGRPADDSDKLVRSVA
jgi:3-phosphoshikimate 1-carboxyvinyltransferase